MEAIYQKIIEGLKSSDPQILIQSALWLIDNASMVPDANYYMQACEILYTASLQDVECLKYIDENLQQNPIFKAQLFAQILRESPDQEIKDAAVCSIDSLIHLTRQWKNDSTEIVAQIYSYLESSGDPVVIEKARQLL